MTDSPRYPAKPDFEAISRQMAAAADGWILDKLLAAHFSRFVDPKEAASLFLHMAEQAALGWTPPWPDRPEVSDFASQEFRDLLVRRILRARALVTQEPFDPEAYQRSYLRPDLS